MLGVMPSKLIKGCNSLHGEENLLYFQNNCQEVMSLTDMLNRQYRTDAHFTCYNLTGFPQWPLLNKSILSEIREEEHDIVLAYMAFDWDNDNHSEWTNDSITEFSNVIHNCKDSTLNSWSAIYTTLHGARIIYTMSQTAPADEAEQHLAWMFHRFKENGFTRIDESCKDYTRRFRCPQVIRDNKPSWEDPFYCCMTQEAVLDMNLVGKRSPKTIPRKTFFLKGNQERPAFGVLESLLFSKDKSTLRSKQTEYYKKAKRILKESEYLDILFNAAAPSWGKGHRNDEIVKMLGRIVPKLIRKTYATVQQVFALAVNPLLTLDNDQDWVAHGWNALLDIYERETNKFNQDKEIVAERVVKEQSHLDSMVEGMKEWCDAPELYTDEENARQYVKSNCMAHVQGYVYTMDTSGRYTSFPISKDQIISRIRKTFLNDIIKTDKINYTGEEVDVSVITIINDHSSPVSEIQMKPIGGEGGHIEDINGDRPIMVLSTFCRNDNLIPTYDPFVDDWLQNLFGVHYEIGCAWIGNALAFEEGLICALSIEGASSAGKKLLTEGLAECLKVPCIAGPEDMYQQSSAFLKTCFLVINEAWPNVKAAVSPADKFKSITGGDGIIVNEKFKPMMRILCPVRIVMTANDDGIIKELIRGKDMGHNNRDAIGQRLYHFKASEKAELYLKSIGGRGFTAKEGNRWIRPDSGSGKSDFIVAKHFLWLYKNRDKVDPTQRFLVMGNCSPGASAGTGTQCVIEKLLADNNSTPIVALAIIELMAQRQGIWSKFIIINKDVTRLWVTRNGVHRYIKEVKEERISEPDVFSGMLNLMEKPDPDTINGVHWYEISARILSNAATERGIAKTLARTVYMNRIQQGIENV